MFPRRRHVKCGEEKPGCQRCIKWRGRCDGYEDIPGSKEGRSSEPEVDDINKEPISLKSTDETPRWYSALAMESQKLMSPPNNLSPTHKTESNTQRYGGIAVNNDRLDDMFWRIKVPYLLRNNTSVWYANLAIHALVDAKSPQSVADGSSQSSYSRALKYHGMALSQVRREAVSLQSATLCCLFFVIFEMMSGDERAAKAHMYSGCRMMDELRRNDQRMTPNNASTEVVLFKELQKALRFLELQVRGSGVAQERSRDSSSVGGRSSHSCE